MKPLPKLPLLTFAAMLLSGVSVHALERGAYKNMAQAAEERNDDAGPAAGAGERDPGEAREKRGGGEESGERPSRQKAGGDDGGQERPARPRREESEGEAQQGERPTRRERKPDVAPKEVAPKEDEAPAPAQRREKTPSPKAEDATPPAEKAPPVDDVPATEPPAAPKSERKATDPAETAPKEPEREPRGEQPRRDKAQEPAAPKDAPAAPAPVPKAPDTPAPDKGADAPPAPERKAAEPAAPSAAPSEVKDLKELKAERKERKEEGGRVVIEEPDKRVIVKEGDKTIIRADETERFRRLGGKTRREKRNGLDISVSIRPGGIEIFTETDDRGRPLRRYRRDRDGREVILFDNRDYYRRHRDGSFVDAIVDLPPPRLTIPRETYIVDYEEASDSDVYDALSAPPIERLERTYSLEEVRRSPSLRDRMRRIDLDVINFNFGAWDVAPSQYPALERIANAINRVVDRNPNEVFLIEGHTDAVGSDEDNLSLSDRRAETVAIILTEEFRVPPENIVTQGYGEQYLKIDTPEAERQNRRVAIRRITPLISRAN